MRFFGFLVAFVAFAAGARADGGAIGIEHAWSRPAASGQVGVVYLTITDSGAPDALTAVAAPVADQAMLHQSSMQDGVSAMRMVDRVPVAQGMPARLAPGGMHVMLVGLKRKLSPGDTFPLTLTFAHAGTLTTTVTVEAPGAR